MKLSHELEDAFNQQITLELEASAVYRQLGIEMELRDFTGIAEWFRAQSDEEITHAQKFIDHLTDRGSHAQIGAIAAPKVVINTVEDAFTAAAEHEQRVSEAIRSLYRAADTDFDSRHLLEWFLNEQVEEEDTISTILGRVKIVAGDGTGLLQVDRELAGAR